jgi:fructose-1,6-bisphosphatase/inositol monophosphatase family enzyme
MTLTHDDLKTLAEHAIEAAISTGKYISETRPLNVDRKDGGDSLASQVVTEVDHESQRRILQILAPTFSAYKLGLLTEERADDGSRLENDYFWCIDPIDGTLCFIEGMPGYAISIALVSRKGIPVIGVVYDPATHTLYHAIRDGGAFRNTTPWQPDLCRTGAPPTIFTDLSEADGPRFASMACALKATWGTYGGAVMNAIRCLENPPALYFKFPKPGLGGGCFWDFAALACIYKELGAPAFDNNGLPLNLNRADSVHLNHCGVLFATDLELSQHFLKLNKTLG